MISLRLPKLNAPRRPVSTKRMSVRTRAAVVPEMMDVLTNYVCPSIKNCVDLYVGTDEHQIIVLSKLRAIAEHFDIVNSEEYIVRALLLDDDKLAVQIAYATDMYHQSIDLVREAISKVPSIKSFPVV
jgi:hypothetical protein